MDSLKQDLDECMALLDDDRVGALYEKLNEMKNTIYLDKGFWECIKLAAKESPWIPPEYFVNDWVSDVCGFLREDNWKEKHS